MKMLRLVAIAAAMIAQPVAAQSYADGSGVLAAGGAAQTVFGQNSARHYVSCQNPITATETLFVNIDANASTVGGSIELAAGGSITFGPFREPGIAPVGIVSVTAATTGHRFVCKQW